MASKSPKWSRCASDSPTKHGTRKNPAERRVFSFWAVPASLFVLGVTGTELVDPSCGVHQSILPRVERVARRAHLHFNDRVLIAVLPLLGLFALRAALSKETPIRGQILENDRAVVLGVDAFFHEIRIGSAKIAETNLSSNPLLFLRVFGHKRANQQPELENIDTNLIEGPFTPL